VVGQLSAQRRRRRPLGEQGERLAARFLRRQGMRILARQLRTHWGEVDLIAVDGRTIVFVEVKTRRAGTLADALEAITVQKQRRLMQLALAYLRRHDLMDCAARFDVVAIVWPGGRGRPEIHHIRNAFSAAAIRTGGVL
jgi:putative endonuclease